MLSTAGKVRIAEVLSRGVITTRRLVGRPVPWVQCRRRGVRWRLNLQEGIQLALYLGIYERHTLARLRRLAAPGAVVIDIGANIGAHTLPLARAVGPGGQVVAVEPTAAALAQLRDNLSLNPELSARVVTVHSALGRPGGRAADTYYSHWDLSGQRPRHPVAMGSSEPASGAGFTTLDSLAATLNLPSISLVKIDVDGAELDVFAGADHVLGVHRPVVVFEICPYLLRDRGETVEDVTRLFTAYGYDLLDERSLTPAGTAAEILASTPANGGKNLIARPRELG